MYRSLFCVVTFVLLRHFLTADMEKFHEVWIMNEERCKEMTQKLLDADRMIFEQQLGLIWTPNDLTFMNNVGPIDTKKKPKSSIDVVRELLVDHDENVDNTEQTIRSSNSHFSNDSMKAMLQLLCDEGVRER
jgi:dynein regulatry complex protein 1